MPYQHIKIPSAGAKITVNKDYTLTVPSNPIIPFIAGDPFVASSDHLAIAGI